MLYTGNGDRGDIRQHVTFDVPFTSPPAVMIAIARTDIHNTAAHRITVYLEEVDEEGFVYTFKTWADTQVWAAEAMWIAVATRSDTPVAGD